MLAPLVARRRHRLSLGAVRRTGTRPDPDRRGAAGRERRNDAAAADLCRGCRDIAGAGAAGRRPCVRAMKKLDRRRRMDPPRPGCRGAGRRSSRSRSGSTPAFSPICRSAAPRRWNKACSTSFVPIRRPAASAPAKTKQAKPSGQAEATLPVEGLLTLARRRAGMAELAAAEPGGLKGKVVLVDFWTYSCINCLRSILICAPGPRSTAIMAWS